MLICPVQPLTTLTPEQVADITASVRRGQSWHAFEAYKKHKAQLENAAIENAKVAGQRDNLLAALVSLSALARRYLPDYDEHPEVQKADAAIARIEVEVK